jgi:hypothetical protein
MDSEGGYNCLDQIKFGYQLLSRYTYFGAERTAWTYA